MVQIGLGLCFSVFFPWVFEPALFLALLIFFFFFNFFILDWSPDLWFELYVCLIVFFMLSLPHQLQVQVIKKSEKKKVQARQKVNEYLFILSMLSLWYELFLKGSHFDMKMRQITQYRHKCICDMFLL